MESLFTTPIPVRLSFDELIAVTASMDFYQNVLEQAGMVEERQACQSIIDKLEAAARPAVNIMQEATANGR